MQSELKPVDLALAKRLIASNRHQLSATMQAAAIAEIERNRAEITRLTEALRAAEEREEVLREALAWYGEQARLARLIHSEGDAGRHALQDDGGLMARQALAGAKP